MTGDLHAAVVARLPGAAALGLAIPSGATVVPGTAFADRAWTARRLAGLARWYRTDDPRLLGALWWYSAAAVLVAPALAGLVAGLPLSARLEDTSVGLLGWGRADGGLPIAATSSAPSSDVGAELRETLSAVAAAVVAAGGVRPRPLWAVATDAIAGRLLELGRVVGDVPATTALAERVAAAVGPPLLAPRFVDVGRTRFVRRVSCCSLYRAPGQEMCASCPRRPPAERSELLGRLAALR